MHRTAAAALALTLVSGGVQLTAPLDASTELAGRLVTTRPVEGAGDVLPGLRGVADTEDRGDALELVAGAGEGGAVVLTLTSPSSEPAVIIDEAGAVVATCAVGLCDVPVEVDGPTSFAAQQGEAFDVVAVGPVAEHSAESDRAPTSAGLIAGRSGSSVSRTDSATLEPSVGAEVGQVFSASQNGWTVSISTELNLEDFGSGPTYSSTAWYRFHAYAVPPPGLDPTQYAIGIFDAQTDFQLCFEFAVFDIACNNYDAYDGFEQHDIVARVFRFESGTRHLVAEVTYGGWYDRYLWAGFWARNPYFPAGEDLRFHVDAMSIESTGGRYALHIQDVATGEMVGRCLVDLCDPVVVDTYYTGERAYRMIVADPDDPSLHVAAVTEPLVVPRAPWSIGLYQYGPVERGRVEVIAPTWQDVGDTNGSYRIFIVDATTGSVVAACSSGTECIATVDVSRGHAFQSVVASSDGPDVDVQAQSEPQVFASNGGGSRDGARWETSGGSNLSVPSCQTCAADPVNTYTGEYWERGTDLRVGPLLSFDRGYGSTLGSIDQGLGHGWSSNLGMQLQVADGSSTSSLAEAPELVVVQENGSFVPFTRTPDGLITADRVQATLTQDADGSYLFSRRDGSSFVFSAAGELLSTSDLNGRTTTLTHDAAGHPVHVEDDRGRFLALTWADGRIAQVADSTGRIVTLAYSAEGDLVAATAADGATTTYTYDAAHQMTSFTDELGATVQNLYLDGRVIEQTDPLGRVTTFGYDIDPATGDGSVVVTDPDGRSAQTVYHDGAMTTHTLGFGTPSAATTAYTYVNSLLVAVTGPDGSTTTTTYDERGNPTSVTDPLGRVTTSTYTELNRPATVTDAAGASTVFAYDGRGNLVSSTTPDGAVTTFEVNPDGTVASATDALGRVTSFTYDSNGLTSTTTGPDGATLVTVYDSVGNLLASTDPLGTVPGGDPAAYTSTFTYDAAGRLLTGTDPLGAVVTSAYDAAGRPTSSTDALGAVTTRTYDLAGQMGSVTDAVGSTSTFTYDGGGRVLTATDATGAATVSSYDALGRLTTVTDPLGRTSRREYDARGRIIATVAPSGARTTYTYDAAGQLLTVTDPLGGVTTTTYDPAGRPVTETDAEGRTVTTSYDLVGRATGVTKADGSAEQWVYDAAGQLTTYLDAASEATSYGYGAAGRRTSVTDAAGRVTTSAYDVAGHLVTVTHPDGQTTSYGYDRAGRPTSTDYSDATPDVTTTFDAAGRPIEVIDGTGSTSYTYDAVGRVEQVSGPGGTVGYSLDGLGRVQTLTYPTGGTVTYVYDAAGQVTGLTDWAGRTFTYTWTLDGQVDTLTYPNGVVTTTDHSVKAQTLGITSTSSAGTELLDLGYAYSPAGLLTDQTTTRSTGARAPPSTPTTTSSIDWDAQARVSQITGHGDGLFAYDAAGSPTTLPGGRTLAYGSAGRLTTLTTDPGAGAPPVVTGFTYDAHGNRQTATTGAEVTTHQYDLANRLISLAWGDRRFEYTYSANNLRASATTHTAQGTSTETYTWDTAGSVPLLLTDTHHAYLYGPGTAPLAQVDLSDDTAVDYLHADTLGSIRMATDPTGQVTADADYDAYGTPDNPTTDVLGQVTRFGYAGQYTDPSGYVYLRNRYYDPTTAQFLTIDPLVDATRTPYGYTGGNPLQRSDPLGLWDWQRDLGAAVTTGLMLNPVGWVAGVGDWDDADGQNVAVNALQSYAASIANGVLNLTVNISPLAMAAQPFGWSGVHLDNPNACNDLYTTPFTIGQYTPDTLLLVATLGTTGVTSGASRAANIALRPAQVAFGPVPENAWATFGRVQSKGSPLPGFKGGWTFGNTGQAGGQVLPRSTSGASPITYAEWDVNPYVKGVDRGAERIVTGSDGSAYYTSDHYRSFTQFWSGG